VLVALGALAGCGGGDSKDDEGGGDSGKGGASGDAGSAGTSTAGTDPGGTGGADAGTGGSKATGGGKATGGTTGKGGTAGTATGATGPALDRIEAACDVDCDAQYATECAPVNGNTLTCKTQCAAITGQLGDFCLIEYAEVVECRGQGGYDCVNNNPYQRSTCAAQQQAFQMCTMDIGCKRSCKKSVDESCTSMSLDQCIEACIAKGDELPTDCSYYWDTISSCKVQAGTTCVDGELTTPNSCAYAVMEVADCVSDDKMDMCEGWCWAANTLGCAPADCVADCQAKSTDTMCGTQWDDLLDCALFFGDAECIDGELMGNGICDSEVTAYSTCIAGGM
jgi:hypothetical protein